MMKKLLFLPILILTLVCLAACQPAETPAEPVSETAAQDTHTHRFEDTVVPPSCTEGYTLHVCAECGYSYTDDYTDALGHVFTDVRNDTSCNAYRTVTHTCSVCGYSYTETTDEKGSLHDFQPKTVVYPTRQTGGYTVYVCRGCGLTENRDPTDPVDYSTGLKYSVYSGKTYVTGLGTCTDTDLIIPTVNEYGQTVAGLYHGAFSNDPLSNRNRIRSVTVPETCEVQGNAFSGCKKLVSLTIPLNTCSLGDLFSYQRTPVNYPDALTTLNIVGTNLKEGLTLSGCPTLTKVTLDDRIRRIPSGFFGGCSSLSDIRFSDRVTGIGDHAFSDTAITSFTVPETVTSIPYGAFVGCKRLTAVIFHPGVRSIGREAFYRCSGLASIDLPGSLTELGSAAFSECTSLRTVAIPESLTELPEYAFSYCSSLTGIVLHDRIRSMGFEAFAGTAIASFTFPETITEDNGSFNRCKSLTEIHYHAGMTKIGPLAECSKLRSIELPQGITEIPTYCFSKCSGLEEIVIPASVTGIGYCAFEKCSSLRRVVLPEGLTAIEQNTFDGCTALTGIDLPDSVASIGNTAFNNCKSMTGIRWPSALSTIGQNAFAGSGLTEVTIDRAVTVGNSAFAGCLSLRTATLGASAVYRDYLFQNCTALETLTVGEGVTYLPYYALDGCSALTTLTLPSTLTSIGSYAFRNCSSLTDLTLPASLTSVGSSAFSGCTSVATLYYNAAGLTSFSTTDFPLTALVVGANVEVLPSDICKNRTLLASVTLPAGLRVISGQAFLGCTALTSVNLPAGLETIGDEAFRGSGLVSVTFSSSSLTVGTSAFRECLSLTGADFGNGEVRLSGYAFYGCAALTGLTGTDGLILSGASDLPAVFHRVEDGMHLCMTTLLYIEADAIDSVVVIPDSVTAIADKAFRNSTVVREVRFPAGLKTVGASAFEGCTRLQKIILPDSVTAVGASAFEGCAALTEIVFSEQLEVIPSRVIYGCTKLTSVAFGGSLRTIAPDFYLSKTYFNIGATGTRSLYEITYNGTSAEWNAVAVDGESFLDVCTIVCTDRRITHTIASGSMTGGSYTVDSDRTLTLTGKGSVAKDFSTYTPQFFRIVRRMVLSEGITELSGTGASVFTNLEEIVFPSTLASFPLDSFSNSPWYQNGSFYDANGLFLLNNSLIRVRRDLSGVLELPSGLKAIGASALASCQDLTEVRVPSGVKKLGEQAFFNCTALVRVILPEGLTEIGTNAFLQCTALTDIELPSTLNKMGRTPFHLCSSLEKLTVPAGVSGLSVVASNCENLKYLIVKAKVKTSDRLVWYCDKLEVIVFEEGTTGLGENTIYECRALRAVVIPQSVTQVNCVYPPTAFYFRSATNMEAIRTAILARTTATDIDAYLYSETQLAVSGSWHFDENGLPVLWD